MARLNLVVCVGLGVSGMLPVAAGADGLKGVNVEREPVQIRTSAFFYVGQFSATRFNQIVRFDTDFQSSWVAILGVTREFLDLGRDAHIEGELNVAQHWGMQDHQEVNAGVVFRWKRFPWDPVLNTSFGYGLAACRL